MKTKVRRNRRFCVLRSPAEQKGRRVHDTQVNHSIHGERLPLPCRVSGTKRHCISGVPDSNGRQVRFVSGLRGKAPGLHTFSHLLFSRICYSTDIGEYAPAHAGRDGRKGGNCNEVLECAASRRRLQSRPMAGQTGYSQGGYPSDEACGLQRHERRHLRLGAS